MTTMPSTSTSFSKKINRSTKLQIAHLCQYMHGHPDFAAGDFKTPQGAAQHERQWKELKDALDELGPNRTIEQWKVCWRDQKRKARAESAALNKAKTATGNHVSVPDISENALIVLDTIGSEMAVGIGPEESPIGFSGQSGRTITEPEASGSVNTAESSVAATAAPTKRRCRIRKGHPSDKFLNAQTELNRLVKMLVEEVRHGNRVQEERNRIEEERNRIMRRCSRSPLREPEK